MDGNKLFDMKYFHLLCLLFVQEIWSLPLCSRQRLHETKVQSDGRSHCVTQSLRVEDFIPPVQFSSPDFDVKKEFTNFDLNMNSNEGFLYKSPTSEEILRIFQDSQEQYSDLTSLEETNFQIFFENVKEITNLGATTAKIKELVYNQRSNIHNIFPRLGDGRQNQDGVQHSPTDAQDQSSRKQTVNHIQERRIFDKIPNPNPTFPVHFSDLSTKKPIFDIPPSANVGERKISFTTDFLDPKCECKGKSSTSTKQNPIFNKPKSVVNKSEVLKSSLSSTTPHPKENQNLTLNLDNIPVSRILVNVLNTILNSTSKTVQNNFSNPTEEINFLGKNKDFDEENKNNSQTHEKTDAKFRITLKDFRLFFPSSKTNSKGSLERITVTGDVDSTTESGNWDMTEIIVDLTSSYSVVENVEEYTASTNHNLEEESFTMRIVSTTSESLDLTIRQNQEETTAFSEVQENSWSFTTPDIRVTEESTTSRNLPTGFSTVSLSDSGNQGVSRYSKVFASEDKEMDTLRDGSSSLQHQEIDGNSPDIMMSDMFGSGPCIRGYTKDRQGRCRRELINTDQDTHFRQHSGHRRRSRSTTTTTTWTPPVWRPWNDSGSITVT